MQTELLQPGNSIGVLGATCLYALLYTPHCSLSAPCVDDVLQYHIIPCHTSIPIDNLQLTVVQSCVDALREVLNGYIPVQSTNLNPNPSPIQHYKLPVPMHISDLSPTPIRGNFIPVSGPLAHTCPSPQRQHQRTDPAGSRQLDQANSQMERLASAYVPPSPSQVIQRTDQCSLSRSLPGHCSPQAPHRRARQSNATETIPIALSPEEADATMATHNTCTRYDSCQRGRHAHNASTTSSQVHLSRSRSGSPAKRARSPDRIPPVPQLPAGASINLADRRNNQRPTMIDIDTARQYDSVSKRAVVIQSQVRSQQQPRRLASPAPLRRHPNNTGDMAAYSEDEDTAEYYSEEEFGQQAHPSYISPLRIQKPMQSYNRRSPSAVTRSRGLQKTATTGDLPKQELLQTPRNYSPLSEYLTNLSQRQPVRKELVGKNGWLERPNDKKDTTQDESQKKNKKRSFIDNLKKLAKDVTSSAKDITSSIKAREKGARVSRLTVSLDPREQSLLYCELEFLLTTALDSYINSQLNAGRLDISKYKRIVDAWQQRGRPKVVGFRYDLETQVELVLVHSEAFRFYGKRAGSLAAVNGVLDMMRVDARAMR